MKAALSRVVVVGASSGMGEAMARQLAAAGADVAIVARREGELTRLASERPGKLHPYVHDVSNVDEVPALFERIERELGGVDGLIYAAGVMPKLEESEYAFEKDRAMVTVNLLGAMAWMNQAAARFEAARTGTILGISSIAGERGRRGNPGYCTTKAALTTYLEALRNRCSRYGVNVVTIKPGFVDTAMTRGLKGLFWLISAEKAAKISLSLARKGNSGVAFVPSRWALVAFIVRSLPSFIFRKLNF
ncbi:MAG TPA: SDR family NAD(P)-dependent oxidoreductase [Polyangiaceae bacterium]|nr:SDR family NAD(P)-dependent oxidoreductase [Polyangiaceae bacterium]